MKTSTQVLQIEAMSIPWVQQARHWRSTRPSCWRRCRQGWDEAITPHDQSQIIFHLQVDKREIINPSITFRFIWQHKHLFTHVKNTTFECRTRTNLWIHVRRHHLLYLWSLLHHVLQILHHLRILHRGHLRPCRLGILLKQKQNWTDQVILPRNAENTFSFLF